MSSGSRGDGAVNTMSGGAGGLRRHQQKRRCVHDRFSATGEAEGGSDALLRVICRE